MHPNLHLGLEDEPGFAVREILVDPVERQHELAGVLVWRVPEAALQDVPVPLTLPGDLRLVPVI